MLTTTQIGILKDVRDNKVSLDDCGDWLRDQLLEITMLDGPLLIDTDGPSVILTDEGETALKRSKRQ